MYCQVEKQREAAVETQRQAATAFVSQLDDLAISVKLR